MSSPSPQPSKRNKPLQPLWLRVTHWLNAVAVLVMVTSGWRIYNASPIFDFVFPADITLGGWLGGALQWHFAGMWLFVLNGLAYLLLNLATGRFARRLLPVTARGILRDAWLALTARLSHGDMGRYNQMQRAAYLFAIADLVVLVLSGLVVWKSVQFPLLRELLGGYDTARHIHFYGMAAIVGFACVHLVMVVLVPRSLLAMLLGRSTLRRTTAKEATP
ncbi:cytochrome B [Alicycliphilus denitrificans]|uniref:Cytochrome B n=1 Tax=Alicycliphilus denitrificans TaxID=179636 RepID=A0A858ZPW3_9BURK|nr:cytochrome b/b6 domain-containing protein [Alicycliphilus denitrificans]ADU98495.1 putative transmembrane hydrogenase cytochrome [Alicycliphilus denitrificans BC]QKD42875.1 cytochrome B [Alicycliphilus denitrificans]GAO20535.1 thiosulfate reductase cytochrome B subunit [Alicycliphilus sp. B1]GAO26489.1 thiosulfate reductase cytochrome b subunit [Alicycliphilus sp. B1]